MRTRNILDTFSEEDPREELINISRMESLTILKLLVFAATIDGTVTREELDDLAEEYRQLPFGDEHDLDDLLREEGFVWRGDYIEALASDRLSEFLEGAAKTIVKESHRRVALEMVALLIQSDGVDDPELDFCFDVGRAFDIPREEIERIVRKAWEHRHPPLTGGER